MTKILLATHNKNKKKEIKALLKGEKAVKVMMLDDLDFEPPIIVEDGRTFRQNSVKKAVTMSRFFDGLVLADDSGLAVDALGGKPGVRSARFARAKATDEENNKKLLTLLARVPEKDRKAKFVCNLSLAKEGHLLWNFEGAVQGTIRKRGRGQNGFGYDPLFVPKGEKKTFAEMSAAAKNTMSHRAIALEHFKKAVGDFI